MVFNPLILNSKSLAVTRREMEEGKKSKPPNDHKGNMIVCTYENGEISDCDKWSSAHFMLPAEHSECKLKGRYKRRNGIFTLIHKQIGGNLNGLFKRKYPHG